MQLRTLQIFCAVASHGSFSRAAASLGLTQSAASQAVLHLEEHLGSQLVDRSVRPLGLTRAGQLYRDGAQKLLHDYRALEEEVRTTENLSGGRVSVAAIYSVGLSYLPDATAEFQRTQPDVEVNVEYSKPIRVAKMVSSGEVDLGLLSYPEASAKMRVVIWQQEPMRMICSPGHSLASRREVRLSDLNGMPLIAFEQGLAIRREIDRHLAMRGVQPRVAMSFDNIDSLIRAVQANQGISIMPEAAVRREIAAGSLYVLPCVDLNLTRPLGICWRRGGRLGPAARQFAALLLGRPLDEAEKNSVRADASAKVPEAIP